MRFLKKFWNRLSRLSRLQKIIIIVVIGGIVVLLIVFRPKNAAPQYQTTQVTRGSVISTISESGNVSAGSQVNVSSSTDGVIEAVYTKNGDQVSAGQNLFKVKSTATPAEKEQAYASYLGSQNSANQATQSKQAMEATLEKDRQSVLNAQDAVDQMNNNLGGNIPNPSTKSNYTQNEIDSIKSSLTSAQESFTSDQTKYNQEDSDIAAAQASLNAASLAYQETQDSMVTAPIDGTVANFSVVVGSNVSGGGTTGTSSSGSGSGNSGSGSSNSGATPVLVLGNFSQLSIVAPVSEVDIASIHVGEKATITLDAYPDKTFVGLIVSVDTIGTSSSGVVTYNAYISFISPPPDILPGMSATAVIETARHDNVLMVPSTAVQTINGQSFVRVMKNGQVSQVSVTTGVSSDTDTEITSGLSEGQTVVTSTIIPTTGSSTGASPFGGGFGGAGGARGFGGGGFGGSAVIRGGGGGGARVFVAPK